jgi:predicted ATP-dependent endonuclease of OLD family
LKIKSIEALNFKSFGNDARTIIGLDPSLNTIVGENNVGKSNCVKIIQKIIELLQGNSFTSEDYHNGDTEKSVVISLHIILEDADIISLMESFSVPLTMKDGFNELFGDNIDMKFEMGRPLGMRGEVKFGKMYLNQNYGSIKKFNPLVGTVPSWNFRNFVFEAEKNPSGLYSAINNAMQNNPNANNPGANTSIDFGTDTFKIISNLLSTKIVVFSESRTPIQSLPARTIPSPNLGLADMLYGLKNGAVKDRTRFESIKTRFSSIFPHLKLDVIEGPKIVLAKSETFEVKQESISSGIMEIINILTHLMALEQRTIIFDEPEIHLHPHAKRTISNIIKESSTKNQIICITHSTSFVFFDCIAQIILVKDNKGQSEIIKIQDNYFEDSEIKKLLRISSPEQKEFLFAKAVLLVEGDTELGAMPIFAKKLGLDLDERNISIISVDSHFFATFVKILKGFKIPHKIMCDRDALTHIEDHIEKNGKKIRTSSLVKQLDILGYLGDPDKEMLEKIEQNITPIVENGKKGLYYDDVGEKELEKIVEKLKFVDVLKYDFEAIFEEDPAYKPVLDVANIEFKKNKVLKGRYLAENIANVPENISNIIKKLTS